MLLQYGPVLRKLSSEYVATTPLQLKIIDVYLLYVLFTGIIQFVYACVVGTFPFNSFLAGFISSVASFILAVNLRTQVDVTDKSSNISKERAFGDFMFCHVILHLAVFNLLG